MKSLLRWLFQSLIGRIFALYSVSLLLFTLIGLGLFYRQQFTQTMEEAYDTVGLLTEVLAPTVSDSAVIGDYDTVQRILVKAAALDKLASASFISVDGAVVQAPQLRPHPQAAPRWIRAQVAGLLLDTNRNLSVGGKDYGVLRLSLSADTIANEVWDMTWTALLLAMAGLLFGLGMIWIPLRRMDADLEKTTRFAGNLVDHRGDLLEVDSRVRETQALAAALNRVSLELRSQHQALADSERRKGAILEASLDCFITIDDQGRIVDFNPAAERSFGYRAEEARGQVMSALIVPPALRDAHERGMRHYLQTGEGPVLRKRIEISALRRSGEIFPIELTIVPFETDERKYFAGYVRDISERKRLEAEQLRINGLLKESLRRLEDLKFALDQHAIVSIANAQGNISYVNEKFSEISGYSADELIGQNHRLLKSGLHPPAFYHAMWDDIGHGRVWHGQLANSRKNGEIYWVESTIVPWIGDDGLPNQYVSIRTDITAQKSVELALAQARQRELEIGQQIQQSLLFDDVPAGITGALIATYTEASQGIDGDFYAVTRFGPDCFEILVGDVMGKGVPAALIGAAIKTSYNQVLTELLSAHRTLTSLPSPAEIVNLLHQHLTPRLISLSTFATLALYRFDLEGGTLTVVNAGHTPGLLARAGGAAIEAVTGDNLPIGVLADEIYTQHCLPIHARDVLLVYSDGVTETRDAQGLEFGIEGLTALFQAGRRATLPPAAFLHSLRYQLRGFAGSAVLADDSTALMVELRPRPGTDSAIDPGDATALVLTLPWRLDVLSELRQGIALVSAGLPEADVASMTLAAFEAATNAIRHTPLLFKDATLSCCITRTPGLLLVELFYPADSAFIPPDHLETDFSGLKEGGFGLYIIQSSVDELDYGAPMPGIGSVRLARHLLS